MILVFGWVLFERGFSGGSVVKDQPTNAGDPGSIPGSARSPVEGTSNPLQYSCLGNTIVRGAWWAKIQGIAKELDMIQWLNNNNKQQQTVLKVYWVKSLSRVWLFATPWTVAHQAPPSMGFSRQEYWSRLPFPSPGDLPDSGIEPGSPAL